MRFWLWLSPRESELEDAVEPRGGRRRAWRSWSGHSSPQGQLSPRGPALRFLPPQGTSWGRCFPIHPCDFRTLQKVALAPSLQVGKLRLQRLARPPMGFLLRVHCCFPLGLMERPGHFLPLSGARVEAAQQSCFIPLASLGTELGSPAEVLSSPHMALIWGVESVPLFLCG